MSYRIAPDLLSMMRQAILIIPLYESNTKYFWCTFYQDKDWTLNNVRLVLELIQNQQSPSRWYSFKYWWKFVLLVNFDFSHSCLIFYDLIFCSANHCHSAAYNVTFTLLQNQGFQIKILLYVIDNFF